MQKLEVIKGGKHKDERGEISFINDFCLDGMKRFYTIENSSLHSVRAWQGHKVEGKCFFVVKGSFKVACVKVDDWDNPSADLNVEVFTLDSTESSILKIPKGYANGIKSMEEGSKLLSFSDKPLEKSDNIRFDKSFWLDWDKVK